MIRPLAIVVTLLFVSLFARSQKVIDSVLKKSCDCIEQERAKTSAPVSEDSIINCISMSMMAHFDELLKEKKLNPGTVEGIMKIHKKVREMLAKECEAYIKNKN